MPPAGSVTFRRVVVVGAGAIGSLYAGHLARTCEVCVVTRREEHAERLRREGLRVSGKADFVAPLDATADAASLGPFDLAIVATKANDVAGAVSRLAGSSPGAVVMTSQNGLGADQVVASVGPWRVLSAVTFMSGIRHDDRHVEYELDAPTWLGPGSARPAAASTAREVGALLVSAGLKATAFDDVRPALWSKLIFNATVNSVSALTLLPHDRHFRLEDDLADLGGLVRGLVEEGKAVAARAGIELLEDPWEMNLEAVRRGETAGGAYRHLPSMLEDVLAGRPTEVDHITGALVREGVRLGVGTPLHLALYRLVRAREAAYGGD